MGNDHEDGVVTEGLMSLKLMVGGALALAGIGSVVPASDQDPITRIETQFKQDARLDDIGFSILKAAVPFCGARAWVWVSAWPLPS